MRQDKIALFISISLLGLLLILPYVMPQIGIEDGEDIETREDATYSTKTESRPYYEPKMMAYSYSCYLGGEKNQTCYSEKEEYVFMGYRDVVIEQKIISIIEDFKTIKGDIFDVSYQRKGIKYVVFDYDQKDRNMIEFGYCREYEKEKGVCHEIY